MTDFKTYIADLQSVAIAELTEHSKRSALEKLLNDAKKKAENKDIGILHEPKRKENYGAPDFK
ncbi:MAG: hypothetical protein JJT94_15205, partial [Bernardetiaceae bacterium]|nr:hypothetical protein [Bernardetiaceae bacterium]